jgi:hypothetical protein
MCNEEEDCVSVYFNTGSLGFIDVAAHIPGGLFPDVRKSGFAKCNVITNTTKVSTFMWSFARQTESIVERDFTRVINPGGGKVSRMLFVSRLIRIIDDGFSYIHPVDREY